MMSWKGVAYRALAIREPDLGHVIRMQDFHIPFQRHFESHVLLETSLTGL